jgi:hypothetical protein
MPTNLHRWPGAPVRVGGSTEPFAVSGLMCLEICRKRVEQQRRGFTRPGGERRATAVLR